MIHPDIYTALARQRSATLLAEAKVARRARQARPSRLSTAGSGFRGLLPRYLVGWRPRRGRPVAISTQVVPPNRAQVPARS